MNIPNLLSAFRLVLVPVFVLVFFSDLENAYICAAFVYAVACLTDILDGMIARKYNLITRLGRVLDPMADKLMAVAVVTCMTIAKIIPVWAVIILFVKESLMGIGALLMYNRVSDVMPADKFGKAATVGFFAICAVLIVFPQIPPIAATIMIAIPVALTLLALFHYIRIYFQFIRRKAG